MNDRIFSKKVTVRVELKIIAGFVKQHLLRVLQMLPHRQFRGMGIFANQRPQDLIMVVAPVIYCTRVDVVVQFFPVRVVNTLSPHFFHDGGQGGVLRGQRDLHMELEIPFGVTKAFSLRDFS